METTIKHGHYELTLHNDGAITVFRGGRYVALLGLKGLYIHGETQDANVEVEYLK